MSVIQPFLIGEIITTDAEFYSPPESVSVALVDPGVQIFLNGGAYNCAYQALTPQQAIDLGHLLIRAGERHQALRAALAEMERQAQELRARGTQVVEGLLGQ